MPVTAMETAMMTILKKKTFRILQEVAAYLGPTVLTEDEKMSAVLYWKRHCEAYPHLSNC